MCSSNATREYLFDVIESVGRSRGHIMHFRYNKRWVDSSLWQILPLKISNSTTPSEKYSALIVFVYQEINRSNKYIWKYAYPIRFGKIIEWYKTGDGENDVAYFYFETQNYCSFSNPPKETNNLSDFSNEVIQKLKRQDGWEFAALRELSSISEVNRAAIPDISAFQTTVGQLSLSHFQSPDKKTKYFPVYVKTTEVKPATKLVYNDDLNRNSIELTEGGNYTIEASIYLSEAPGNGSKIELTTSSTYFENPSINTEVVGSRYDEYTWQLIPSKLKNDIMIPIRISTEIKPKSEDYQVLNPDISIYLLLKFDRWLRYTETIGDVALAFATILIAGTGLLQKLNVLNDLWLSLFWIAAISALIGFIIKARTFWLGRAK